MAIKDMMWPKGRSIGLAATFSIAWRVAAILTALSAAIFLLAQDAFETQVFNSLEANIRERAIRESVIFERLEVAQQNAGSALTRIMENDSEHVDQADFDALFPLVADGSRRSVDSLFDGMELGQSRYVSGVGAFFGTSPGIEVAAATGKEALQQGPSQQESLPQEPQQKEKMTPAKMTLLMHSLSVVNDVGSAYFPILPSFYFFTPDNEVIIRAPSRADKLLYYRQNAPGSLDFTDEEFLQITLPENNPTGQMRCTRLNTILYDQAGNTWTTGCMTPFYYQGAFMGAWGSSILLNDLLNNAIADHVEGAENMIITSHGNLIAHPRFTEEGSDIARNLDISQSGEPELIAVWNAVAEIGDARYVVKRSPDGDSIWAIGKIEGPDWYFVIRYPQALITAAASELAYRTMYLGLVGLLIVLLTLHYTLRKRVVEPLNGLVERTRQLASGQFDDLSGDRAADNETGSALLEAPPLQGDEIDILSRSTEKMARDLQSIFATLEKRVENRTNALKLAKQQAEYASAAKTDFLANMSHELRTPLTGILGILDLLAEARLSEQDRSYVLLAQRSSNLLLALVNDILDLSRLEAGKYMVKYEDLDLCTLVQDTVDSLVLLAEQKGLRLSVVVPEENPCWYRMDAKILRQILVNLVGNAIKYTDAGQVTVALHVSPVATGGARIRLDVSDTGPGIAPDEKERLFERFHQMPSNATHHEDGAGLGLAICHDLVDLVGGSISVDSVEGVGSRFTVNLTLDTAAHAPMPDAQADPHAYQFTEREQAMLAAVKILAVDDNTVNRMLIENFCKTFAREVTVVASGREMIELYKAAQTETAKPFDILLMDINMPDMDGIEALKQIRAIERGGPIPAIALTADALEGSKAKYQECGLQGYTTKPIVLDVLKREILDCLTA